MYVVLESPWAVGDPPRLVCGPYETAFATGGGKICADGELIAWLSRVLLRDFGVCALCGGHCLTLANELQVWRSRCREGGLLLTDEQLRAFAALIDEDHRGEIYPWPRHNTPWDMDHIVPVIEGGGECGLENLRTLCKTCHEGETAKLARRRAAARHTGGQRSLFEGTNS